MNVYLLKNAALRLEIEHLKANGFSFSLLNDAQLLMYTGVTRIVFESLLTWLQPVIQPNRNDYGLVPSERSLTPSLDDFDETATEFPTKSFSF